MQSGDGGAEGRAAIKRGGWTLTLQNHREVAQGDGGAVRAEEVLERHLKVVVQRLRVVTRVTGSQRGSDHGTGREGMLQSLAA